MQIELLEKKVNFIFPRTFKEFYGKINGFNDWDWDENMFTIYPIERIEEEYFLEKKESFVPFCDYLICSHQIGFNKNDGHIYINHDIDKNYNHKVADTFEKSLLEIINNTDKVY